MEEKTLPTQSRVTFRSWHGVLQFVWVLEGWEKCGMLNLMPLVGCILREDDNTQGGGCQGKLGSYPQDPDSSYSFSELVRERWWRECPMNMGRVGP